MSSEAVLTPAVTLAEAGVAIAGIATLGVGVCAYGVGKLIKGVVDRQVEAAIREMEVEKARIREWQAFQEKQHEQMTEYQKINKAITESEKNLASIKLVAIKTEEGNFQSAKGYVSSLAADVQTDGASSMLMEITKIIQTLPDDFVDAARSPYKILLEHKNRLEKKMSTPGELLMLEEVISFRENISRTLDNFSSTLKMEHEQQEHINKRANELFDELLTFMHLTDEPSFISELSIIKDSLISLMNAPMKLGVQIDTLERKYASIRAEIETAVVNKAFRSSLAESLTRNLADMGYQTLERFSTDTGKSMRACMRMPEGERVNIAIQSNNKLSFQVCHETGRPEHRLSPKELAAFRKKEEVWCNDLHRLIRKIAAEGFEYNIGLERFIPEASIPVVVVESADDILEEEGEEEMAMLCNEPGKRHFDA